VTDDRPADIDLSAALADARGRLTAALDALDEAAAQTLVQGDWRVRDVIAHVAAWDEQVAAFLSAVAEGQREFEQAVAPDNQWAEWNAEQVRAARTSSLEALMERLHSARDVLLSAAQALDDALLGERIAAPWGVEDTPRGYLLVQATHDAEHAREIARARGIAR
jgi:uncharacterized damage-inducible protein DinB